MTSLACSTRGAAAYCCEIDETKDAVCRWAEDLCYKNPPKEGDGSCPSDMTPITYKRGRKCNGDYKWQPFCCTKGTDPKACYWAAGTTDPVNDPAGAGARKITKTWACSSTETEKAASWMSAILGIRIFPTVSAATRTSSRSRGTLKTLPVPLNYLFDEDIPDSDNQSWAIRTDQNSASDDPNRTSFGWHIMSGPDNQITSISKRDGTHWEVYGCDPVKHEGLGRPLGWCARTPETITPRTWNPTAA